MAHVSSTGPCARCGGDADFDIASLWLCVDCYHIAGSTCAGIGRVRAAGATSGPTPATALNPVLGDADQVC